jgi:hypothetical protein
MNTLSATSKREFAQDHALLDGMSILSAFEPHTGGQEQFFHSIKHQIVLGGGNKSGKTYCEVVKAAMRSLPEKDIHGKNTGYLLDPYVRLKLPYRQKIFGWFSTYSQPVQTETIQPVVDNIFDKTYLKNKYTEKGCHHWIETEIAHISFKWQKAEVHSYTGADLDWLSMDEPHDRAIYYEGISRLVKKRGYAWIGLTAVIDAKDPDYARKMRYISWMKKELIDPFHYESENVPELDVIYVDIEENPHVQADFAMRMWASLSEEERTIRKTGRFQEFIGQTAFDSAHISKLQNYLRSTPKISEPEYGLMYYDDTETDNRWKVTFTETVPTFPEHPDTGWIWKIWEHPILEQLSVFPGYAIAADPAGGKRGNDYTAVYVMRVDTGRIVAALHGYIDEIELAKQLWLAGYYYGSIGSFVDDSDIEILPARVAVEIVGIGRTCISYLLNGHPDFDLQKYPPTQLYRQPNKRALDSGLVVLGDDYGWYTSNQSRPHLVTAMRQWLAMSCDAIDAINSGKPGEVLIPDKGWIKEARTFIMNNSGKFEAVATCYDDRLFAASICSKVVEQARRMNRTWQKSQIEEIPKELWYHKDGIIVFNPMAARQQKQQDLEQKRRLYY